MLQVVIFLYDPSAFEVPNLITHTACVFGGAETPVQTNSCAVGGSNTPSLCLHAGLNVCAGKAHRT